MSTRTDKWDYIVGSKNVHCDPEPLATNLSNNIMLIFVALLSISQISECDMNCLLPYFRYKYQIYVPRGYDRHEDRHTRSFCCI